MTYSIKEIFYTLQGEGANAGRPAVFCRFSGCNLWSGLEADRPKAVCKFCDTDFVGTDGLGGGKFATATELATRVKSYWPTSTLGVQPFVVCTGGEPGLQVDERLVSALHREGFVVAIETNGTVELPDEIDWITLSPKAGTQLRIKKGNELKVVWPQKGMNLDEFESLDFAIKFLQPLDDASNEHHTQECVETCLRRPHWRLSLQTHKYLGIR